MDIYYGLKYVNDNNGLKGIFIFETDVDARNAERALDDADNNVYNTAAAEALDKSVLPSKLGLTEVKYNEFTSNNDVNGYDEVWCPYDGIMIYLRKDTLRRISL